MKIVKGRVSEHIYQAFVKRLQEMGYESQSEWLREQIRIFLFGRLNGNGYEKD